MLIRTKIDELIKLLKEHDKVVLDDASRILKWDIKGVEKVSQILDRSGLIKLIYPINIVARPWLELKEYKKEEEFAFPEGTVIDEYTVAGQKRHITSEVKIIYSMVERRPVYYAKIPEVSVYTRTYFDVVKDEISKQVPIEIIEVVPEEVERGFEIRHKTISKVIEQDLAPEKKDMDLLCGILINDMYGLGDIEILIADDTLEEIVINSSHQPVAVYHRKHGWLKTNISLRSEEEVENYSSQIARKIGKQISLLSPILDAHLVSGDRVNATLYPISTSGNTITLRLFARNPWTIVSFLGEKVNVLSVEIGALLWQAVHYEMNVLVAGGTASGKTSTLNSLVSLVQPFQRVVTIEDTRELSLPSYQWNWVPLVTRAPNPEGMGEIKMLDLIINALRMRPDRIVMGEIRRKEEAEVLFEAMHTGHSVYATMHADTGSQVIKRLLEPPIELPPSEIEDVHLLLVQYRDRRKNIRRTLEISEIVSGASGPELNHVYLWRPRTDKFQLVKPPHKYFEQMNLHTGMTEKEITDDQENKKKILQWMVDNRLTQVDDVGALMKVYYGDENVVVQAAEKNLSPSKII